MEFTFCCINVLYGRTPLLVSTFSNTRQHLSCRIACRLLFFSLLYLWIPGYLSAINSIQFLSEFVPLKGVRQQLNNGLLRECYNPGSFRTFGLFAYHVGGCALVVYQCFLDIPIMERWHSVFAAAVSECHNFTGLCVGLFFTQSLPPLYIHRKVSTLTFR